MTQFKQTVEVTLDAEWVSSILITAFDGGFGGSWYWAGDEPDVERVTIHWADGIDVDVNHPTRGNQPWDHVTFHLPPHDQRDSMWNWWSTEQRVVLGRAGLERAWKMALEKFPRTETARQLNLCMTTGDCDIDAEAADVLAQLALFGDIIFG